MNIIVQPYGSTLCYCRPDTTWERENKDFYSPERVNEICWTPVVFARICKAGKCIGNKFAARYYDGFNFGILLYCKTEGDTRQDLTAFTSCIDHTSILPTPLYNPILMENTDNEVMITNGSEVLYRNSCSLELKKLLEDSICKASELTSLRIGDFVALELSQQEMLTERGKQVIIKANFCENELFSNKIII